MDKSKGAHIVSPVRQPAKMKKGGRSMKRGRKMRY